MFQYAKLVRLHATQSSMSWEKMVLPTYILGQKFDEFHPSLRVLMGRSSVKFQSQVFRNLVGLSQPLSLLHGSPPN